VARLSSHGPRKLLQAQQYLAQVAAQWDMALNRLKSFVQEGG
jgi:hypothetical protein